MRAAARGARIAAAALTCALVACGHQPPATAGSASPALRNPASSSDGGRIYVTNCSSCHQPDGRGVPGAFPPLAGSRVVTGDPRRVIAIVKFGSRHRIRAGARTYDAVMPGWDGLISAADIADVTTYIRGAWNNAAAPVSEADVDARSR